MFGSNDTTTGKDQNQEVNKDLQTRHKAMKNAENQLTIMLLLVTTLFLILLIPTYTRFIYTTFVKPDTPFNYANSMLFYHVSFKLNMTNNGITFFLYCISGRKFRNDLKEILCCIDSSRQSTYTKGDESQSKSANLSTIS